MNKVEQNKLYAGNLGWKPKDFGGKAFDDALVSAIEGRQKVLGVGVDGVAGPATYGAQLAVWQTQLRQAPGSDPLLAAGKVALYEATRVWLQNIVDLPPVSSPVYEISRSTIDDMIRTRIGLNWSWETPYAGGFEWCGALAARAWGAAKVSDLIRYWFFASTYRLDRWARYQQVEGGIPNSRPLNGDLRKIIDLDENSNAGDVLAKFGEPRAGDILLLGPSKSAHGKHICIVESFDPTSGMFSTIEGNGTGSDVRGQRIHGVVRGNRLLGLHGAQPTTYHARRLIRPGLADTAS